MLLVAWTGGRGNELDGAPTAYPMSSRVRAMYTTVHASPQAIAEPNMERATTMPTGSAMKRATIAAATVANADR